MIIHGPENIAGMPGLIAEGQRAIGLDAVSICHATPGFQFQADFRFGARGQIGGRGFLETLKDLMFAAEAIHIYFGTSFLGASLVDARLASAAKKPVFHTFLGCDARDKRTRLAATRSSMCTECSPHGCSRNRELAIKTALSSQQPIFVSTPDLLDEIPTAIYIPLPVSIEAWTPTTEKTATSGQRRPAEMARPLRILHAPTDRLKKGTRHLLAAVDSLQSQGAPLELVLVENQTQAELLAIASTCDVAVDQLMAGVYGTFAAETMTMGLPTIAWIVPIYRHHYSEDLPILSADPQTLGALLSRILTGEIDLADCAKQSSHFAARVHGHVAVAKQVSSYY